MDEYGFEERLRHLEHVLVGRQTTDLSQSTKATLLLRVEELRKELQHVYKNKKSLQDFVSKYEDHANLLNPATSTFSIEREILTPEVKMELVMAAHDDLLDHFTRISKIKSLEHFVSGEGLEDVDKLSSELAPLEPIHDQQAKQLESISLTLSKLMANYYGTVNTLSEIFISWDATLTAMETHMSKLERQTKAGETDS